jgi:hypothetical protein
LDDFLKTNLMLFEILSIYELTRLTFTAEPALRPTYIDQLSRLILYKLADVIHTKSVTFVRPMPQLSYVHYGSHCFDSLVLPLNASANITRPKSNQSTDIKSTC